MDLSDDVGYSVHDVEDAIALGRLDPACLTDPKEVDELLEATRAWYGTDLTRRRPRQRLLRGWPAGPTGSAPTTARWPTQRT